MNRRFARAHRVCFLAAVLASIPCVASGGPTSAKPATTPAASTASKAPSANASTRAAPRGTNAGKSPSGKKPNAHASAVKTWHTPSGKPVSVDEHGRPMLVLQGLNFTDHVELKAQTDLGGFSAEDLDRASHVMREPSSGNEHPIAPRLLDVLYRVQTHFGAEELRIISAYRTPRRGKVSNHGKGRAMDFIVPGVKDEEVAKFAREMGFVGVGIYPTSGFIHVDVRERSFFWVDTSGPGKRNRTRGILGDVAKKSDALAFSRGLRPIEFFSIGDDVDKALGTQATAPMEDTSDDDDDDVFESKAGDSP